jgi:hypothetical protein
MYICLSLYTVLLGKRKKVVLNTKLNPYVTVRHRPAHPTDEHVGPDFTTFALSETGGCTNRPDTTATLVFITLVDDYLLKND